MDEYEELWQDYPNYKIRQNDDLLPLFIDKPMMYPKGTKFQYNNTGYVILAMVIERVTGLPFDQYFQENVFDVCNMTGTGAGGAFITVKDVVNFWKGLLEGKLLSKEMVEVMLSKHSGTGEDPEEDYYGYGVWIIDCEDQKDIPYFQGCDPGVSFISEYDPNKNRMSVFVSNYGDNVWKIARKLRNT